MFFYDSRGEPIEQGPDVKSVRGTYNWKTIKLSNKAPKGTKSAAIMVLMVMAGEIWIDDVQLAGAA